MKISLGKKLILLTRYAIVLLKLKVTVIVIAVASSII